MIKEVALFDIYVAPLAADLVLAAILFLPIRYVFDRLQIQRHVWHRALFDLAVYVIILSLLGLVI